MKVLILNDERRESNKFLERLYRHPEITVIHEDFDPEQLKGLYNAILLCPIGHYVKGKNRLHELEMFAHNNIILTI